MKVSCLSIADYLENLHTVKDVYDKTIRVSVIRRPVDGTSRDAIKFDVVLQSSTVVLVNEESEYILEAGETCGVDYEESTPERKGSERAQELKKQIVELAVGKGWQVLPGIISE